MRYHYDMLPITKSIARREYKVPKNVMNKAFCVVGKLNTIVREPMMMLTIAGDYGYPVEKKRSYRRAVLFSRDAARQAGKEIPGIIACDSVALNHRDRRLFMAIGPLAHMEVRTGELCRALQCKGCFQSMERSGHGCFLPCSCQITSQTR